MLKQLALVHRNVALVIATCHYFHFLHMFNNIYRKQREMCIFLFFVHITTAIHSFFFAGVFLGPYMTCVSSHMQAIGGYLYYCHLCERRLLKLGIY